MGKITIYNPINADGNPPCALCKEELQPPEVDIDDQESVNQMYRFRCEHPGIFCFRVTNTLKPLLTQFLPPVLLTRGEVYLCESHAKELEATGYFKIEWHITALFANDVKPPFS